MPLRSVETFAHASCRRLCHRTAVYDPGYGIVNIGQEYYGAAGKGNGVIALLQLWCLQKALR